MSIQNSTIAFICLKRYAGNLVVLVHEPFFDYVFGIANTILYGLLGAQPDTQHIAEIKNILTRLGKNRLKQRFGEKVFIYSFLAASGTFFLSFFFLSIVIRDPIPIIDELLVSIAASIAIYWVVRKRVQDKLKVSEFGANIVPRIASLQLRVHELIRCVEDALADYDAMDVISLQALRAKRDKRLATISPDDAKFLEELFTAYIESAEYRTQTVKNRKSFKKIIASADSDVPLEILMEQLKKIATPQ